MDVGTYIWDVGAYIPDVGAPSQVNFRSILINFRVQVNLFRFDLVQVWLTLYSSNRMQSPKSDNIMDVDAYIRDVGATSFLCWVNFRSILINLRVQINLFRSDLVQVHISTHILTHSLFIEPQPCFSFFVVNSSNDCWVMGTLGHRHPLFFFFKSRAPSKSRVPATCKRKRTSMDECWLDMSECRSHPQR